MSFVNEWTDKDRIEELESRVKQLQKLLAEKEERVRDNEMKQIVLSDMKDEDKRKLMDSMGINPPDNGFDMVIHVELTYDAHPDYREKMPSYIMRAINKAINEEAMVKPTQLHSPPMLTKIAYTQLTHIEYCNYFVDHFSCPLFCEEEHGDNDI